MKKITLFLCILFGFSNVFSQTFTEGGVTLTDDTELEGSVFVDYSTNKVLLKDGIKTTSYNFNQLESISLRDRTLVKTDLDGIIYFATPLEKGNASLFQVNEKQYVVETAAGEYRTLDLDSQNKVLPGILSLIFSDCEDVREQLNATQNFNESTLRKNIIAYNNCIYTPYAPTLKEINSAADYNTDQVSFYGGVGSGIRSISFFDRDDKETVLSGQLQIGVIGTPSFLGDLQGNLFFSLEGIAAFAGENAFSNVDGDVKFKLNSFRVLLGLEYQFNKEGYFKPFLGLAVGPSGDYYEGSVGDNGFDISGGSAIVAPKVGIRYLLKNGDHLGLAITLITDYENDLTFPIEDDIIPLIVNVQTLTVGFNYYF